MNQSQNPGGHKEGRASFPIKSQYKNLNNPYLLFSSLRERRRTGRERHMGERWEALAGGSVFFQAQGREERGEGVFKVPTQGSKIPLDSN